MRHEVGSGGFCPACFGLREPTAFMVFDCALRMSSVGEGDPDMRDGFALFPLDCQSAGLSWSERVGWWSVSLSELRSCWEWPPLLR